MNTGNDLLYKVEVYAIVGAAFEVYNELGPGFLEAVYHEAFVEELSLRQIPVESHKVLTITYKGRPLRKQYEADLVCFGKIIIGLKALDRLTRNEVAQLLNYLKATGQRLGLLINFGGRNGLEWKRFVM